MGLTNEDRLAGPGAQRWSRLSPQRWVTGTCQLTQFPPFDVGAGEYNSDYICVASMLLSEPSLLFTFFFVYLN